MQYMEAAGELAVVMIYANDRLSIFIELTHDISIRDHPHYHSRINYTYGGTTVFEPFAHITSTAWL